MIDGYGGEPYARLLADGTVEVNQRSPATYLNRDQFGESAAPASASTSAAPQWAGGRPYRPVHVHDHRMHWMGRGIPPAVRDRGRETKVFDYRIPVSVGGRSTALRGALFWNGVQPVSSTGPVLLAVTLLLGLAVALPGIRARRRHDPRRAPRSAAKEAW